MRILQARVVGLATRIVAAAILTVSLGMAQKGGPPAGGGGTPTAPGKGTPTPTPSSLPSTQTPTSTSTPQSPRPIWISGRVTMYDGTEPPEPVTIERVCSSNSVHSEGYAD